MQSRGNPTLRARRPPDAPGSYPDRSGRVLLWLMAALLVVLVYRLSVPNNGFDGVVDGVYGVLATSASRVGYRVFTSTDDTRSDTRLRTLDELRTALTTGQLVVHYQPKVDLDDESVHGAEALVRWNHPSRGLLYPDSFLDLAEDAGLMRQLTQVVLEQAMTRRRPGRLRADRCGSR